VKTTQSTTLKGLQEYAVHMEELTAEYAEQDHKRRVYLDALVQAADGDLSMRWEEAHDRLAELVGYEAG